MLYITYKKLQHIFYATLPGNPEEFDVSEVSN